MFIKFTSKSLSSQLKNKRFFWSELLQNNLPLWLPILFLFGLIFQFAFPFGFKAESSSFLTLLFISLALSLIFLKKPQRFVFIACAAFLFGGCYGWFFENHIDNSQIITSKIYIEGEGKIIDIKPFQNPKNQVSGLKLLISPQFLAKPYYSKANLATTQNQTVGQLDAVKSSIHDFDNVDLRQGQNSLNQAAQDDEDGKKPLKSSYKSKKKQKKASSKNKKKSTKKRSTKKESTNEESATKKDLESKEIGEETTENSSKKSSKKPQKNPTKKISKKPKKILGATPYKFWKDFANIYDFTDLDLRLSEQKYLADNLQWDLEIKDSVQITALKNPPKIISLLLPNSKNLENNQDLSLKNGDLIHFYAVLNPPPKKEFSTDFDFSLYSRIKGIGGNGFLIGNPQILLKKSEKSQLKSWFGEDQFFANLRKSIDHKIHDHLDNDLAGIANALLIGDQSQISSQSHELIRNSGLSHLLSISGFHLSLAALIFFAAIKTSLAISEKICLSLNIKKIAALFAIFGSYFYLGISGMPIPAQRAFVAVLLLMGAVLLERKFNALRALLLALIVILLVNPLNLFSASLQLSFVAVLMLINYFENIRPFLFAEPKIKTKSFFLTDFLSKAKNYLIEIIVVSLLIQVATLPFLLHHFHKIAPLSFVANLAAIPLASFIIMPLGFLSLFLMPFGLEFIALKPMGVGIGLLLKIATEVGNLEISKLNSPHLPSSVLLIAIVGLLIFCLTRAKFMRIAGITVFASSFFMLESQNQPTLILAGNQKIFAIYQPETSVKSPESQLINLNFFDFGRLNSGQLFFSKPQKPTKKTKLWFQHFGLSDKIYTNSNSVIPECEADFHQISFDLPESLPIEARKNLSKKQRKNKKAAKISEEFDEDSLNDQKDKRVEQNEQSGQNEGEENIEAIFKNNVSKISESGSQKSLNFCQKCNSSLCALWHRDLSVSALIITGRNRISKICDQKFLEQFNLVVNFSGKYLLPDCLKSENFAGKLLENRDFFKAGNHLILPSKEKTGRESFRIKASN